MLKWKTYFSDLSLTWNWREAHMFHLAREVEKIWWCSCWEKVTLSWLVNSNMIKPEKFDHFHLVYHFTIPLSHSRYSHGGELSVPLKYRVTICTGFPQNTLDTTLVLQEHFWRWKIFFTKFSWKLPKCFEWDKGLFAATFKLS